MDMDAGTGYCLRCGFYPRSDSTLFRLALLMMHHRWGIFIIQGRILESDKISERYPSVGFKCPTYTRKPCHCEERVARRGNLYRASFHPNLKHCCNAYQQIAAPPVGGSLLTGIIQSVVEDSPLLKAEKIKKADGNRRLLDNLLRQIRICDADPNLQSKQSFYQSHCLLQQPSRSDQFSSSLHSPKQWCVWTAHSQHQ